MNNHITSASTENTITRYTDIDVPIAASQEIGPKSRLMISPESFWSRPDLSLSSLARDCLIRSVFRIGITVCLLDVAGPKLDNLNAEASN